MKKIFLSIFYKIGNYIMTLESIDDIEPNKIHIIGIDQNIANTENTNYGDQLKVIENSSLHCFINNKDALAFFKKL